MRQLAWMDLAPLAALTLVACGPDEQAVTPLPTDETDALSFISVEVGDRELLTGERRVDKPGEPVVQTKMRFRFDAVAKEAAEVRFDWKNSIEESEEEEWGELRVRMTEMSPADYLARLRGPIGAANAEITGEENEERVVGDQTFTTQRLNFRSVNEYGVLTGSLWVAQDAPAARIVAIQSRHVPAPNRAYAGTTELELEINSHGDRSGAKWSKTN